MSSQQEIGPRYVVQNRGTWRVCICDTDMDDDGGMRRKDEETVYRPVIVAAHVDPTLAQRICDALNAGEAS